MKRRKLKLVARMSSCEQRGSIIGKVAAQPASHQPYAEQRPCTGQPRRSLSPPVRAAASTSQYQLRGFVVVDAAIDRRPEVMRREPHFRARSPPSGPPRTTTRARRSRASNIAPASISTALAARRHETAYPQTPRCPRRWLVRRWLGGAGCARRQCARRHGAGRRCSPFRDSRFAARSVRLQVPNRASRARSVTNDVELSGAHSAYKGGAAHASVKNIRLRRQFRSNDCNERRARPRGFRRKPNRLINEQSPVLLRHNNPADRTRGATRRWRGRAPQNKPVLLHRLFGLSLVPCDGARVVENERYCAI